MHSITEAGLMIFGSQIHDQILQVETVIFRFHNTIGLPRVFLKVVIACSFIPCVLQFILFEVMYQGTSKSEKLDEFLTTDTEQQLETSQQQQQFVFEHKMPHRDGQYTPTTRMVHLSFLFFFFCCLLLLFLLFLKN